MMSEFRKSLTWRDTVKYAIDVYGFLIDRKGWMSGKEFADVIRKYYSGENSTEENGTFNLHCAYNERAYICASEIEKHVANISILNSCASGSFFTCPSE